jgi:4-amino-4-deoxy-L-arabinose transferase-like glycosyltransferase
MDQPFGSRRRELLIVGAVVLLGLLLRVVHVLLLQESPYFDHPSMDMDYHVQWARAFAAGETFEEEAFFRAPLYPWFLGVCLKIFGPGLLAPRLVQALLGATSVALTYLVGKRAFSPRAGLLAATLVATSWVLVHFDGLLLIPALAVPLDLLALYLTLGLTQDPRPRRAALAGGVWGLSAIARPNVLLFMPLLAGWLLLRNRASLRRGLASVGAMAAGCLVPILPITAINLARGDMALISTQAGVNLWIGNNPSSDGSTAIVPGTRGGWWEGRLESIALAEEAEGRELSPTEVSRHYTAKALSWIAEEPGAALAHLGWKARLFWLDVELGNNLPVGFFARRYDPLMRASPVGFSLLAGLGILGLVSALRRSASRSFPVWGFLLIYSASVIAFFVCSRFRLPVLPVLAVLSGEGLVRIADGLKARDWRSVSGSLGLVLVAILPTRLVPEQMVDPNSNGHLALGRAALRDEDLTAAEEHFARALELRAANAYARVGLAETYRRQGLLDQAILTSELGLSRLAAVRRELGLRQPGEPELLTVLVQVHLDRDGPGPTAAVLQARLRRDPGACAAYDLLAQVYRRVGDAEAERGVLAAKAAAGCR